MAAGRFASHRGAHEPCRRRRADASIRTILYAAVSTMSSQMDCKVGEMAESFKEHAWKANSATLTE